MRVFNINNILFVILFFTSHFSYAQHQEVSEKPLMYKGKLTNNIDTTSLLYAFKNGNSQGHFRYFFMNTINKGNLSDYYANAAGGGIRYETAKFYGFQIAISGFYTFNIGSSDFTKPDATTGQFNRYEIALFDIEEPTNNKDLYKLEEFYLKYNYKNSQITFGKQLINTPFINLQDGRMRPTGVEGIWLELNKIKNSKIEVGYLYAISPRGTVKWYDIGKSIGVYPTGVNIDGTKSLYTNNIESKGVALLGITTNIHKNIKLQGWNMFTENVFNSAMLQADINFPNPDNTAYFGAIQCIRQDAINDGGNVNQSKTYFAKGQSAVTFGAKLGWKNTRWEMSINFNRITAKGRYLVPREWGRDPFFTFMPRERNDGLGDVNAFVGKASYNIPKASIKASLAAGYYKLPDVKNYRLNKYGLPSYTQINADVRYSFKGFLNGLDAQLLLVAKFNEGEIYNNEKYEINRVNMLQTNFVLNFHF